eukprot:scaffold237350_cov52-Prasinocladus_malaysianus.AAC.1
MQEVLEPYPLLLQAFYYFSVTDEMASDEYCCRMRFEAFREFCIRCHVVDPSEYKEDETADAEADERDGKGNQAPTRSGQGLAGLVWL